MSESDRARGGHLLELLFRGVHIDIVDFSEGKRFGRRACDDIEAGLDVRQDMVVVHTVHGVIVELRERRAAVFFDAFDHFFASLFIYIRMGRVVDQYDVVVSSIFRRRLETVSDRLGAGVAARDDFVELVGVYSVRRLFDIVNPVCVGDDDDFVHAGKLVIAF